MLRDHLLLVGVLLALCCPVRSQSTLPASRPTDPLDERRARLTAYQSRLQQLKTGRIATLLASDEYAVAVRERNARLAELEAARKDGTPQQKMDASTAYGKARKRVEELEKNNRATAEEVELEKTIAAEIATIRDLKESLDAAHAEERARQKAADEARAARKALEDLVENAPEVRVAELETVGERYKDKLVKMTGVTFNQVSNSNVDALPGVEIASNGLQSLINTREQAKWIGFTGWDKEGKSFWHFFAQKEKWADVLLGIKEDQRVDVLAMVVPRVGSPGQYCLVCVDIKVVARNPNQD